MHAGSRPQRRHRQSSIHEAEDSAVPTDRIPDHVLHGVGQGDGASTRRASDEHERRCRRAVCEVDPAGESILGEDRVLLLRVDCSHAECFAASAAGLNGRKAKPKD
jgi:hypothetical protein